MTGADGHSGPHGRRLALPSGRVERIALLTLVPFFALSGANHFLNAAFYLPMMPPYLPAHLQLIYVSGAAEILGGIGVLLPATRRAAGWGLILLLLAIFPANLHMALHPELFPEVPVVALYGRLPFQGLFILWVWWATRPAGTRRNATSPGA